MLRVGELLPEPAPEASAAKRPTVRDSVKLGDRRRERTMAQCLRRFDSNAVGIDHTDRFRRRGFPGGPGSPALRFDLGDTVRFDLGGMFADAR
jgi:hypothetical protein